MTRHERRGGHWRKGRKSDVREDDNSQGKNPSRREKCTIFILKGRNGRVSGRQNNNIESEGTNRK